MNKYLEKLAREYYTQTKVEDDRVSSSLGTAAVGGLTAHQLNKRLGNVAQKHLVEGMYSAQSVVPHDVVRRIGDDVLQRTNTTLHVGDTGGNLLAAHTYGGMNVAKPTKYVPYQELNTFQRAGHAIGKAQSLAARVAKKVLGKEIMPEYGDQFAGKPTFNRNFISAGKATNSDVILHEMGKAVDMNSGAARAKRVALYGGKLVNGIPAAAIGGLALTNEKTRDYAWAVPLLAAAPALREEAAAGLHANSLLKAHGGVAGSLKGIAYRKLAQRAIPALAASGALAGINYLRHKGEEVNPDEWIKERD